MVPPSPRLRRTVVVPFSSLARCEAWRVARPNLFGGGARPLATPAGLPSVGQPDAYGAGESRVPQRQRVSPRARWGFVRESSPYSSLLGRCPIGRGVLGLLSRPNNGSTTTTPAPRGLCEKSPNLAAELPLPLGAAALALCFAFPNGFSVGTGATRSAKQHPSGRLRRCPSGSAYSQNRARKSTAIERGTFSVD